MIKPRTAAIGVAAALGVGLGSYGIASATQRGGTPADDSTEVDEPIDASRAADATVAETDAQASALDLTGGGTVNGVELGDENGTLIYELDITDPAGSRVEVKVDASTGEATLEADDEADDEADGIEHEHEHEGGDDPEGDWED